MVHFAHAKFLLLLSSVFVSASWCTLGLNRPYETSFCVLNWLRFPVGAFCRTGAGFPCRGALSGSEGTVLASLRAREPRAEPGVAPSGARPPGCSAASPAAGEPGEPGTALWPWGHAAPAETSQNSYSILHLCLRNRTRNPQMKRERKAVIYCFLGFPSDSGPYCSLFPCFPCLLPREVGSACLFSPWLDWQ